MAACQGRLEWADGLDSVDFRVKPWDGFKLQSDLCVKSEKSFAWIG